MSIFFVPTCMPIASAKATNASQPNSAVFQWLALQRPIRAARLYVGFKGDTWLLLSAPQLQVVGLAHRIAEADAPVGRKRERVLEGGEGVSARDVDFERLVEAAVGDGHLDLAGRLAPEQQDLETVVSPARKLRPVATGSRCVGCNESRCAHDSCSLPGRVHAPTL